jgi:hypothetical protein
MRFRNVHNLGRDRPRRHSMVEAQHATKTLTATNASAIGNIRRATLHLIVVQALMVLFLIAIQTSVEFLDITGPTRTAKLMRVAAQSHVPCAACFCNGYVQLATAFPQNPAGARTSANKETNYA